MNYLLLFIIQAVFHILITFDINFTRDRNIPAAVLNVGGISIIMVVNMYFLFNSFKEADFIMMACYVISSMLGKFLGIYIKNKFPGKIKNNNE